MLSARLDRGSVTWSREKECVCIYIYIYIYVCVCVCMCERARKREREGMGGAARCCSTLDSAHARTHEKKRNAITRGRK